MTVSMKTLLAIGLMLLAASAGGLALGDAPTGGCGVSGEPTCEPGASACQAAGVSQAGPSLLQCCIDETPAFAACAQECNELSQIYAGSTWKIDADALILHRSTPGTRTLLFDTATGVERFDASEFHFPFAAGPRISLTALDCEGWGFEGNFFMVDGWSSTRNVPSTSLPNAGNLAVDSVNQITLVDAQFDSTSRFYSSELNFRKPLFGNLSFLTGFRYLDLTDIYNIAGTSATTGNTSTESILTHNHLFGWQIGADGALLQKANCWRLSGFVKAGVFLDCANQATSLSDPGGLGALASSANNQASAAFFGEAGLKGYYQLSKHFALSGGYEVMFLNNIAQPVNQLADTNLTAGTATVDVSSALFYHGATAGLEVTW